MDGLKKKKKKHNETVFQYTDHFFSLKGPQGPQGPVGFPGPKGPNVSNCNHNVRINISCFFNDAVYLALHPTCRAPQEKTDCQVTQDREERRSVLILIPLELPIHLSLNYIPGNADWSITIIYLVRQLR